MATISALGGEINLRVRHGHPVGPFQLTWSSGGTPYDYTGAVWDSVIRETWSGPLLDTFDIGEVSPPTGVLSFLLPQVRAVNLIEGKKYVYLISVTPAGGWRAPFVYGSLILHGA